MKLSRNTMLAAVMAATGLVFTVCGSAHAQRAVYRNVSGYGHGHAYSDPCPCPTDDGAGTRGRGTGEGETDNDAGTDLPEVADLSGDTAFASASQSAAPNAIGDSLYPGINFFNASAIGSEVEYALLDPAGGRRFKATHNNSAVPQTRIFASANYFHDAQFATSAAGDTQQVSPWNYELGAEYAFWCNMASVQVRVPMNYGFENDLTNAVPLATGNEFGNVQVALKTVLCQDACTTWSAGLGLDLPTADDLTVQGAVGGSDLVVSNDVVTLSPYLATLRSIGCNAFAQAFAQVAIPLEENDVTVGGVLVGDYQDPTLLYLDLSLGYWLNQDCCGNGLLALAELHYTNALTDDTLALGTAGIAVGDYEMLNATIGVSAYRNCWVVTPAVVLPILDDAVWDYEFAVQVNRRF